MKNSLLLASLAAFAGGSVQAQSLVYDNTQIKLGDAFGSTSEFGDEVYLGGTDRQLTSFAYSYTGTNFGGGEMVTFRLYANDGPAFGTDPVANEPGTLLYSSTDILPVTTELGGTLTYDLTGEGIIAPNILTWTVSFSGIDGGEYAVLNIYNPPDIGQNPDDFWIFDAVDGWTLSQIAGGTVPANFGARIVAVPEPSTVALGLLAMGALGLAFRRKQ